MFKLKSPGKMKMSVKNTRKQKQRHPALNKIRTEIMRITLTLCACFFTESSYFKSAETFVGRKVS